MKKLSFYLTYYPLYSWMYVHALLPLRALYILSDILYVLVYKVIRYRLRVVRKNLENSFPDKTEKERREIEVKFYHHFCDYIVETIKLFHISDEEASKRIVFKNTELLKDFMKDGSSSFLFLGHYGNWEWVPAITRHFPASIKLGQVYRPLRNKAVDAIFLKLRSRFGSFGIPKDRVLREIVERKQAKEQILIGFMADQTPTMVNTHYWTQFLNQETPVFTGVERIAKKMGYSVGYLDIQKVRRGYYECTVKLIADDSQAEENFSITEKYIREIEKTIMREPAYWLWTHKRWKFTRKEAEEHKARHHHD